VRFGGKECIKYLVRLLRWKPHAGIAERDQYLPLLAALRLDDELAHPAHILHRINAVHHEVHQNLL
jgi:hypothetical protein